MNEKIAINESKTFHPEQWVKVYGVFANRCDYIVICQVYQLEALLNCIQLDWWDKFLLEPVDEES